jgi:hypothetical protein
MPNHQAISTVYHVGHLDTDRSKPYFSHEGNGVCISHHPEAWRQIADDVGGDTYELRNPDAEFYVLTPSNLPLDEHRNWCIENDFVEPVTAYRAYTDDNRYTEHYDEADAKTETHGPDTHVEVVESVTLDSQGVEYWEAAFDRPVSDAGPVSVRGLLPVWYAENSLGVDGVWWNYDYAPHNLSCPCGVIFQDSLCDWSSRVDPTTAFKSVDRNHDRTPPSSGGS